MKGRVGECANTRRGMLLARICERSLSPTFAHVAMPPKAATRKISGRNATKAKTKTKAKAKGTAAPPGAKKKQASSSSSSSKEADGEVPAAASADAARDKAASQAPLEDPWLAFESPYGGRMSPADEWNRIQSGALGSAVVLTRAALQAAGYELASGVVSMQQVSDALVAAEVALAARVKEEAAAAAAAAVAPADGSETAEGTGDRDPFITAAPAAADAMVEESTGADAPTELAADASGGADGGEGEASSGAGAGAGAGDGDDDADAGAGSAVVEVEPPPPVEQVSMASCGITAVTFGAGWDGRTLALDLTDNRMDADAVEALNTIWLRILNLTANSALTRVPTFTKFTRLLSLDLSHNRIGPLTATSFVSVADNIRELGLAYCGLETLLDGREFVLKRADSLEKLTIAGNAISNVREVRNLGDLNRLTDLDLRGNPFLSEGKDAETAVTRIKRRLARLKVLNGASAEAAFAAGSEVGALADSLDRSTITTGGGDDNASCSCIEGNPCAVPYNCKNWDMRFEVARKAREVRMHACLSQCVVQRADGNLCARVLLSARAAHTCFPCLLR